VCLCVSGSVAAVKAPELARELLRRGVGVDLVVTEAAHSLLQSAYRGVRPWAQLEALIAATDATVPTIDANAANSIGAAAEANRSASAEWLPGWRRLPVGSRPASPPSLRVFRDADEWRAFSTVGSDSVLHIELAKRNRLLLIAPLCANTLASAALGLCNNLLGSVLRAWYYDLDPEFAAPLAARYGAFAVEKPVVVAPAMNTFMWHQRVTRSHVVSLEARGVHVVPPIAKKLACGDTGVGAMAEVPQLVDAALEQLREHLELERQAEREGKPPFVP